MSRQITRVARASPNFKLISSLIKQKLGAGNVFDSESEIESHSFDALRLHRGYDLPLNGYPPMLVVAPRSIRHVKDLFQIARKYKIPLYPRGAGTGLMGGAVALRRNGLVIDFRNMDKVVRINEKDQSVTVQPGARIGKINNLLKNKKLWVGHDPWTRDYATVGGSISTNGMGYYGGKYGSMGDQVLGIRGVLPDGTMIHAPAVPYSSTGFDLRRLFIGTEGTFGLITEATLRCFPIPETEEIIAFSFPTFDMAFQGALKLRDMDLAPASIDITGEGYEDGPCEFYFVFCGSSDYVDTSIKNSEKILSKMGGSKLGDKEASSYWAKRHDIADLYASNVKKNPLSSFRSEKSFDFVHVGLPTSKIVLFKDKITSLAKKRKITIEEYGVWIKLEQFNFNFTREEEVPPANLKQTVDDALRLAIKLGGTVEYCHGVGFRLAELLPMQDGEGFGVLKRLKKKIDPDMILNPGKLGFN
jgi:FAD/FMN-containing dehydrogenase